MKDALAKCLKNAMQTLFGITKAEGDEPKKPKESDVNDIDLTALADLGDTQTLLMTTAKEAGHDFIAAVVTAPQKSMFDMVDQGAVDYASERSADLVSGITDTTREEIRRIVAEGLDENLSTKEIAEQLQAAYAFSDDRAALIADNEVATANSQGALIGMQQAADIGVKIKKTWSLDALPCPVCQTNADEGPIPLDQPFPSGDQAPTAHPNCHCVLTSEIET